MKDNNEEVKNNLVVGDVNELLNMGKSITKAYTNIIDGKMLFNLENNVDNKINDCVGETIRVVNYLIKVITTPLEPVVNEETGELEEKTENKRITILVDDTGKSYVTASKMFGYDFAKLVATGIFTSEEFVDIKINKKSVKNSSNQALSFELV